VDISGFFVSTKPNHLPVALNQPLRGVTVWSVKCELTKTPQGWSAIQQTDKTGFGAVSRERRRAEKA
jgi:hypothetical protein